jgi:hypothetical protein
MRRMPHRVLAFFLACLMLWSGLSTYEPPELALPGPADAAAVLAASALAAGTAGSAAPRGSVADHHLDDQPAQTPADLVADLPALLKAPRDAVLVAGPGLPLPARATTLRPAPWLAGLLRPPCDLLRTA